MSDEDLEIIGAGYGLHREALDTDFTVGGLLAGVFGTKAYIARQGASCTGERCKGRQTPQTERIMMTSEERHARAW